MNDDMNDDILPPKYVLSATKGHLVSYKSPEILVDCPTHGVHENLIHSTIKGYEGHWCMKCALDLLGSALPTVEKI